MAREEKLYTATEISKATGLTRGQVANRRKRCGIPGSRMGYTVAQVKEMMIKKPDHRKASVRNIAELQAVLKNDGYL